MAEAQYPTGDNYRSGLVARARSRAEARAATLFRDAATDAPRTFSNSCARALARTRLRRQRRMTHISASPGITHDKCFISSRSAGDSAALYTIRVLFFLSVRSQDLPAPRSPCNLDPLLQGTTAPHAGYIDREKMLADKMLRLEELVIAGKFDYEKLTNLSIEARQKLSKIQPRTIGQASRISGVSPADINVLLVLMGR